MLMTKPEVTFGDVELDEQQRADVRGVLRRIRSDSASGAWPSRVDHIRVTDVLAGGQSGALVLGIDVYSGSRRLARVAKIDSPAALAAEWDSYVKLIKPDANVFFAPIVAVTPDIVTPPAADRGPGAVVYAHAAQFVGHPELPLRTLEDLVRAAHTGSTAELDHVLRVIEGLLSGAAQVLYDKYESEAHPSTLRSMNLSLGPNVVLSVDGRTPAHGGLVRLPDDEVLARTVGGPEPAQLGVGADIALNYLHPDPDGLPGIARGDNIVVAIRPVGDRSADLTGRPEFAVHGRVVETRGAATRSRMLAALAETGPVDPANDGWLVAGTEVASPFGVLLDVLTRAVPGRVRSLAHGDLNPRNALVIGDQPCLIDYSHTDNGHPQQADFCWLELGLVRDVFAGLGFPALVALQRWLALAARVLDHAPDADAVSVVTTLVDRQAPDLAVPFRILLAIRRRGRPPRPVRAGLPWHRDHLEQLLLAAHRTAKWTHAVQTPARLRATVAVASVATEHLGAANGFVRWTDADLAAALAAVAPVLPFADDDSVRLVRALAAAMSTIDGPTVAVLAAARARLVRTRCADRARSLLAERAGHDGYVDLTAAHESVADVAEVFSRIAAEPAVVVCGAAGSGKTTVLREAAYRLAVAILDPPAFDADDPGSLSVRVPVPVDATWLARLRAVEDDPIAVASAVLADVGLADVAVPALELGAPYLLVDNLDRLGSDERRAVLAWLSELRRRYPEVRVLVGQRQPDEPTEFASAILRLRDLDVAGMRAFLHRALARTVIRGTTVDRLLRVVLAEPEWQRLHPERPGVLAMVARHVHRFGLPDGAIAPGDIITDLLLGDGSAGAPRAEDLALVCERIAVRSIEDRADAVALASIRWSDVPDPDGLTDHLVGRDVLRRFDGRVRFADRTHLDYFAAHALRRNLPVAPVDLVRRPHWHAALRVFATLPGVADARDVLCDLVGAACRAAPELAAHLINDARIDDDIVVPFVASCRAVLAEDAVAFEIAEATAALGALGGSAGLAALRSVVADADCRVDARVAALNAIAVRHRRTATGGGRWARDIAHLFTEPCPVPLRVAALAVIAADGLRGLELFVGRCVVPTEPWPVVRAAVATLRALGIALPVPFVDAYQWAARRRLAEVDQALSEPIVPNDATDYLTERADLLGSLTGPDAAATLLAHRFDFLVGHRPTVALDEVIGVDRVPEPCPAYWDILVGDATPDAWVRVAACGEPLVAAAATHRLLRDARDHAAKALAGIDAHAPAHRLLIAAAMVAAAGATGLDHAERIFRDLMPTVDADRLAGAAALLCAIGSVRPDLGVRLAWPAADLLVERDLAERHRWPWVTALALCRGDVAELSSLIEAGDDTAAVAEAALASRDFPRYCQAGPGTRFGQSARQRMLDRAPAEDSDDWESARWALAAANMDLVEALPTLHAVAARMARSPGVTTIGTSHSGLTSWAPFADVLAVLGYLARRAFDVPPTTAHMDRELDDVYRFLSDLDTRETHHSIRTGRIVALAYLGDCVPLVHAVMADPSLGQLGLDAVAAWAPYPHTPRSLRTDAALAEWLAGLRDRPALAADARRVLTLLTRVAERRAGVLFPRARPADSRPGRPDTSGNHDEHMS
jgi:hypothetical protein